MSNTHTLGGCWSTACVGDAGDTSPAELSLLGEHLQACRLHHGRWFEFRCAADATGGFVASRLITSLLVLGVLAGLGALAW